MVPLITYSVVQQPPAQASGLPTQALDLVRPMGRVVGLQQVEQRPGPLCVATSTFWPTFSAEPVCTYGPAYPQAKLLGCFPFWVPVIKLAVLALLHLFLAVSCGHLSSGVFSASSPASWWPRKAQPFMAISLGLLLWICGLPLWLLVQWHISSPPYQELHSGFGWSVCCHSTSHPFSCKYAGIGAGQGWFTVYNALPAPKIYTKSLFLLSGLHQEGLWSRCPYDQVQHPISISTTAGTSHRCFACWALSSQAPGK